MAYPGEPENKEYMDYVVDVQSRGEAPLTKEEWRKLRKTPTMGSEIDAGLGYGKET